jgi:sugar/nucleoside kinase (ribokinase family)
VVDTTGCGDTYLAAYMVRRLAGADCRECGRFAAAAASLNIESMGSFHGSAVEIAARRASLHEPSPATPPDPGA